jgi:hypothetical protein
MRHILFPPLVVFVALVIGPRDVSAQERASVEGFGGLALNAVQATSPSPSLGGTMTFSLTPGVEIVGEAGRLGDVLPALSSTVFSVARTGLRASALYGEGGARFVVAPASAFTPYAEATAGIARLDIHSDRLSPVANAATSLALGYLGRTTPMLGAGGGILVRGGRIVFDVGYRYKQLFADDVMRLALGFGQPLRTHQARVGIGVRF